MNRYGILPLMVIVVGCSSSARFEPMTSETSNLEEQVANHEQRIAALESVTPLPDPGSPVEWRRLSREAGVGLAQIRADICLEAAQREWKSFAEFSQWASEEIRQREAQLYAPNKAALAAEFANGMEPAKFRHILQQQAEGYRSVQ